VVMFPDVTVAFVLFLIPSDAFPRGLLLYRTSGENVSNSDAFIDLMNESGCTKKNRPFMVGWDSEGGVSYVFRPDCKCWNCPSCAARLRARWTVRAYQATLGYMAEGRKFALVTLTCHERLKTLNQTLFVWPKAWAKLRYRVNYAAHGWHFIMIPEQHRTGRLHVHLATDAGLPKRWWKDNGRECGLGYMAEASEFRDTNVSPALVSWYVTKYLGKQLDVNQWPRYFHHIRTSQHYPELPGSEDNPFDRVSWRALGKRDFLLWLTVQRENHVKVCYAGTGEEITP
jgi:hypothetical protein